jgi:hypothetical protein
MATIIVGAYMVRYPLGGMMSWVYQHLVGFKELGHDVYFVEKYVYANSCFNPVDRTMSNDCSYGVKMVNELLRQAGLHENWCFVDHERNYYGMSKTRVEEVFRSADCYIDLGTQNGWEEESLVCGTRILIDGEPGYSQIHYFNQKRPAGQYKRYNYFFTNGYNIGRHDNPVPVGDLVWRHMYSPVNVSLFSTTTPAAQAPFTTVMNWQSHKPVVFNGDRYGQKDIEFKKFIALPGMVQAKMEVAVSGKNIPRELLHEYKWKVVSGTVITQTYQSFCHYIDHAKAEFSVCKNVFVALKTGWFSDKSSAFLAAGRPVVLQDTGFSQHLPCGTGLFAVNDPEQAGAAIDEIESNWKKHSAAAREIAEVHLDSKVVLKKLMDAIP